MTPFEECKKSLLNLKKAEKMLKFQRKQIDKQLEEIEKTKRECVLTLVEVKRV